MTTFASLFSGIGAPDLAASRLGLEHLWACEVAPFPKKVLAKRFPGVKVYDDIRTLTNPERPDILWASPPCQDLSIAGNRAGLDGERSGLFFDFARLVTTLQPTWLVMEQVPGLLSANKGEDFYRACETLAECGYGLAWRIMDSRYLGVPQRRRRIYLVGRLGRSCPAEVLFESESGGWDIAPSGEEGTEVAGTLGNRIGRSRTEIDGHGAYIPEFVSQAMSSKWSKNSSGPSGDEYHNMVAVPQMVRMREGKPGGGKGPLVSAGASLTLATANDQTLFLPSVTSGPKMFDSTGFHRESLREDVTPTVNAYEQPMWVVPAVRRLTPTECERLQGFPDGWTCMCVEKYSNCTCKDGPRYTALGNAVTVNAAEWVLGRLVKCAS